MASNAVTTSADAKAEVVTSRFGHVPLTDTLSTIGDLTGNVLSASEQALNAAIEAARAGEAGAVLPWWTRSLAHRTGESTREIEQMIGGIQQGTNQTVSALMTSAEQACAVKPEPEHHHPGGQRH